MSVILFWVKQLLFFTYIVCLFFYLQGGTHLTLTDKLTGYIGTQFLDVVFASDEK